MLWCALEQASLDKGCVENMRRALKCLGRFIHLPRQWQSFHNDLMTDLTAFLSDATAATIRPGWWTRVIHPPRQWQSEAAAAASGTDTAAP